MLDAVMIDLESLGDDARLALLATLDAGPAGSVSLRATGKGSVTQIDAPIQATGGHVRVEADDQVGARNGLMFVNGGDLVIRAANGLVFGTWDDAGWVDAFSAVSLDELGQGLVAAVEALSDGAFQASYADGVITKSTSTPWPRRPRRRAPSICRALASTRSRVAMCWVSAPRNLRSWPTRWCSGVSCRRV
jgi:hypothetical protein